MEKKVQLKEQEIVGQEVVLSDIYPKTDTTSVEDPVTGASLDVKLDYLVEMINDKLTRVVNSVNNRTGVVVLDASDVGLENVDNVSYADIKKWTDDAIVQMFKNKKIILADTQASLDNWIEENNDPIYDNVLFYIQSYDQNKEFRGMIGYLKYNKDDNMLYIQSSHRKAINTIGRTDESLVYQTGELQVSLSSISDNILKKGEDGLYVDWNESGHLIYMFNSIYDYTVINDSGYAALDGLLLTDDHYEDDKIPNIEITINDRKVINKTTKSPLFKLNYNGIESKTGFDSLKNGKTRAFVIITNSANDLDQIENANALSITPELIHHNTLVGTMYYSGDTGNWSLELVAAKQAASWGLTTDSVYKTPNTIKHANDSIMRVETIGDTSGIQALSKPTQYDIENVSEDGNYNRSIPSSQMNWKFTPEGIHTIYTTTNDRQGGLFIPTDASLMTYSYDEYGLKPELKNASTELSSSRIDNWFANTPYHLDQEQLNSHEGYLNKPTFIGINLTKWKYEFENDDAAITDFIPISGLKVIDAWDANKHGELTWSDLGLDETADRERLLKDAKITSPFNLPMSGGLMVNVGKGLEIMPTAVPEHGEEFNMEGKVSVRLGNGLMFDNSNRVTYDPETLQDVSSGAGNLQAIALIDAHRKDDTVINYRMNPSTIAQHRIRSVNNIHLGYGLRLRIDTEDIRNIILNELTINRLSIFMNHVITYHTIEPASEESGESTIVEHTIKPSDHFSVNSATYQSFSDSLDHEVLSKLEQDYDALEELYCHLQAQRDTTDVTSSSYSSEYVASSVSLTMLIAELASNTPTGNNIKETWDIPKCLEEYSKLHRNKPIGDYIGDGTDTPTNYGDEVWEHDYLEDQLALFSGDDLSGSQKFLLNAFLNIAKAIRQGLIEIGQWETYITNTKTFSDQYASDTQQATDNQIEVKLKQANGSSNSYKYRKDTSGFFGLMFMKMGFNVGGPSTFTTANILSNAARIVDGATHFSYKENATTMTDDKKLKLGELQTGDIIVTDNKMWMFGYVGYRGVGNAINAIDIYGLDFFNGANINNLYTRINNLNNENDSYIKARSNLFSTLEISGISPNSDKTEIDEIITDTLKDYMDNNVKFAIRYIGDDTSRKFQDEWVSA